jgi:ADP-ribosyl-[dinitrogen reductase] hydrolase
MGVRTTYTGLAVFPKRSEGSYCLPLLSILIFFMHSFFSGDALAAPTHWYYGGFRQIQGDYGSRGIQDYTQPKYQLAGSILNKSDLNGGGRSKSSSSSSKDSSSKKVSIIGDVINHGKQDLWLPGKNIHYHATLQKGEPTLEVQLARVLMKSIVATDGVFDPDHFRQAYISFMTTPGSHNDTYASTCHRMFFANLIFRKLDPKDCPDNDHHNVDAIDGLVLPTIVALATSARLESSSSSLTTTTSTDDVASMSQVARASSQCAAVTRKSEVLEFIAGRWGQLVAASIHVPPLDQSEENVSNRKNDGDDGFFRKTLESVAQDTIRRNPNPAKAARLDQLMTACYLEQSLPPLLDMVSKYVPSPVVQSLSSLSSSSPSGAWVWQALIDNANIGGENVHRGSVFGAILGARAGWTNLPPRLIQGLYNHEELGQEINDFYNAVVQRKE